MAGKRELWYLGLYKVDTSCCRHQLGYPSPPSPPSSPLPPLSLTSPFSSLPYPPPTCTLSSYVLLGTNDFSGGNKPTAAMYKTGTLSPPLPPPPPPPPLPSPPSLPLSLSLSLSLFLFAAYLNFISAIKRYYSSAVPAFFLVCGPMSSEYCPYVLILSPPFLPFPSLSFFSKVREGGKRGREGGREGEREG